VVLDNGLTVLLLPEPGGGLVSVGMMYRVGAKNEAAGTTGLAHYAEHMCFRATRHFPGHEITESVTRLGGRWTGYTWIDQTFYQTTFTKEHLGLALDLEADRMGEAVYDAKEFEDERSSVVAELRSYDAPHALLYDEVLAAAFQIHPYRNNTIGWLTDVEAVSRDTAFEFYRRHYHPRNAVLAIGGDFVREDALRAVAARFGRKGAPEGGGEDAHVSTLEPPPSGERRVVVRKPGAHAEVLLAFRAPALREPDFPAMVLFDALLAGGKGVRLLADYEARADTPLLRATAGVGRDARTAFQASLHPYVYTARATTADARALPAAEAALFAAVEAAALGPWSEAELARARREVEAGLARDLDRLADRVHQLAFFEVAGGFEHLRELRPRLAAVSAEDLRTFARERLARERATVGWFVPTPGAPVFTGGQAPRLRGTADAGASVAATSSSAPAALAAAQVAREGRLANGLRIVVTAQPSATLLAVRGRIEAGTLHEARPGTAALAAHAFAAAAAEAGGPPLTLEAADDPAAATRDRFVLFAGEGLPDDLDALARAVAHAFTAGPDRLETARREARHAVDAAEGSTPDVLAAEARARLFPAGSPRARRPWMDAASLDALTAADLQAFFACCLAPARTVLSVAGPVELEAATRAFESAFAAASPRPRGATARSVSASPGAPRPRLPDAPRGPAAWTERRVVRPDEAQDEILVALPGDRSRPHDPAATSLLLYLLGETFYSGRLGRALVEPGLVYSVWTALEEPPGLAGHLVVRTAASPEKTPEVLRRIRAVLEEAARGAFTEDELREAKAYWAGKSARRSDGARSAAEHAREEPSSVPRPAEVTLAQLNDTARRLLARGAPLALVGGPRE
jgi:zinc protease